MEEKKYLKWYNKVGYGSGDIAGNVVYAFLTSFVMIYLTDSVGLASGIGGIHQYGSIIASVRCREYAMTQSVCRLFCIRWCGTLCLLLHQRYT